MKCSLNKIESLQIDVIVWDSKNKFRRILIVGREVVEEVGSETELTRVDD
jgi:hypothetical protein